MKPKKTRAAAQKAKPDNVMPKQHKLPRDPDGYNDERARSANNAIGAFVKAAVTDRENALADLLGNLMHLCDRDPSLGDFEKELARAYRYYEEETEEAK